MRKSASEKLFAIRDLSDKFGVTLRALRFYEGAGLLRPRRQKNSRLYGMDDVARLEAIIKLKKFGFTLAEIQPLINGDRATSAPFGLTPEQCIKQIEFLENRISELETAVLDLRKLLSVLR